MYLIRRRKYKIYPQIQKNEKSEKKSEVTQRLKFITSYVTFYLCAKTISKQTDFSIESETEVEPPGLG